MTYSMSLCIQCRLCLKRKCDTIRASINWCNNDAIRQFALLKMMKCRLHLFVLLKTEFVSSQFPRANYTLMRRMQLSHVISDENNEKIDWNPLSKYYFFKKAFSSALFQGKLIFTIAFRVNVNSKQSILVYVDAHRFILPEKSNEMLYVATWMLPPAIVMVSKVSHIAEAIWNIFILWMEMENYFFC